MKASDHPEKVVDEVITEVRAIKRDIAERHGNDIDRLLTPLISQERASGSAKAEQASARAATFCHRIHMPYYSARLHVVCVVDDSQGKSEDEYICDYPFVIFRASSFESAFERALALGMEREQVYKNEKGEDVRWALNAVETIWELGDEIDGIAVGSIMDVYKPEEAIDTATDFKPASKLPQFSFNTKSEPEAEQ